MALTLAYSKCMCTAIGACWKYQTRDHHMIACYHGATGHLGVVSYVSCLAAETLVSLTRSVANDMVSAFQGGGVFANPSAKSAPAKLRLLYECAPLALIVEAAGGLAECATGSVLDMVISETDIRTVISLGSKSEVIRSRPALRWQQ